MSSSAAWTNSILQNLDDSSHVVRAEAIEQIRTSVRDNGGILLLGNLVKLFQLLATRLRDVNWNVSHKSALLVSEIVPNFGPELSSYVGPLLPALISNLGDGKMVSVRKASVEALLAYVRASQNLENIITLLIHQGIDSSDPRMQQECILAIQTIYSRETDPSCRFDLRRLLDALLTRLRDSPSSEPIASAVERVLSHLRSIREDVDRVVRSLGHAQQNLYNQWLTKSNSSSSSSSAASIPSSSSSRHSASAAASGDEEITFGFMPKRLESQLKDSDWKQRSAAVEELQRLSDELPMESPPFIRQQASAFVQFLLPLLDDPNFKISLTSLQILASFISKSGPESRTLVDTVLPRVVDKWGDNKIVVRQANSAVVSAIMGVIGSRTLLQRLMSSMENRNWHVREEIVNFVIRTLLMSLKTATLPDGSIESSPLPNCAFEFDFPTLVTGLMSSLSDDKRPRVKFVTVEAFAVMHTIIGQRLIPLLSPLQLRDPETYQLLEERFAQPMLPQLSGDGSVVDHSILRTVSSESRPRSNASSTSSPSSAMMGPGSLFSSSSNLSYSPEVHALMAGVPSSYHPSSSAFSAHPPLPPSGAAGGRRGSKSAIGLSGDSVMHDPGLAPGNFTASAKRSPNPKRVMSAQRNFSKGKIPWDLPQPRGAPRAHSAPRRLGGDSDSEGGGAEEENNMEDGGEYVQEDESGGDFGVPSPMGSYSPQKFGARASSHFQHQHSPPPISSMMGNSSMPSASPKKSRQIHSVESSNNLDIHDPSSRDRPSPTMDIQSSSSSSIAPPSSLPPRISNGRRPSVTFGPGSSSSVMAPVGSLSSSSASAEGDRISPIPPASLLNSAASIASERAHAPSPPNPILRKPPQGSPGQGAPASMASGPKPTVKFRVNISESYVPPAIPPPNAAALNFNAPSSGSVESTFEDEYRLQVQDERGESDEERDDVASPPRASHASLSYSSSSAASPSSVPAPSLIQNGPRSSDPLVDRKIKLWLPDSNSQKSEIDSYTAANNIKSMDQRQSSSSIQSSLSAPASSSASAPAAGNANAQFKIRRPAQLRRMRDDETPISGGSSYEQYPEGAPELSSLKISPSNASYLGSNHQNGEDNLSAPSSPSSHKSYESSLSTITLNSSNVQVGNPNLYKEANDWSNAFVNQHVPLASSSAASASKSSQYKGGGFSSKAGERGMPPAGDAKRDSFGVQLPPPQYPEAGSDVSSKDAADKLVLLKKRGRKLSQPSPSGPSESSPSSLNGSLQSEDGDAFMSPQEPDQPPINGRGSNSLRQRRQGAISAISLPNNGGDDALLQSDDLFTPPAGFSEVPRGSGGSGPPRPAVRSRIKESPATGPANSSPIPAAASVAPSGPTIGGANMRSAFDMAATPLRELRTEDLTPCDAPEKEATACNAALKSDNWEVVFEGINNVRRLVVHHGKVLTTRLHAINLDLLAQVDNLRSSICKNAITCFREMFKFLKKAMDADLDTIVPVLLKKTAESNRFLSAEAEQALQVMLESVSDTRVFPCLLTNTTSHKNAAVRAKAANLVLACAEAMGGRLLQARELDRMVQVTHHFLNEGSSEARAAGKNLCLCLFAACRSDSGEFERTIRRFLSNDSQVKKCLETVEKANKFNDSGSKSQLSLSGGKNGIGLGSNSSLSASGGRGR